MCRSGLSSGVVERGCQAGLPSGVAKRCSAERNLTTVHNSLNRLPPAQADADPSSPAPLRNAGVWLVILLLLFLVPLIGVGFYTAIRSVRVMEEEELARNRLRARTLAAVVDREFGAAQRLLSSIAERRLFQQDWQRRDVAALHRHLQDVIELEPALLFASVYDPDGTLRAILPPDPIVGRNYAHRDWYQGALARGGPYVSEVYRTDAAPHPLVVAVSLPLKDAQGQVVGLMMAPYALDVLTRKMALLDEGDEGLTIVFDQRGVVASRPGIDPAADPLSVESPPEDDAQLREMTTLFAAPRNQEGSARRGAGRAARLLAWSPVPTLGWTVVYSRSRREALAPIRELARDGLSATLYLSVIYLGTVGVALLLVRQQRHTEEKLKKSEERYRLFFESSPLPMWVFDAETLRFLAVNEAAVRHYGFSREEFLQMKVTDIRPAEDVPRLLEQLKSPMPEQGAIRQWRHITKDRRLRDVEIVSRRIQFGDRPASLVLVNDITERLRAERQIDRFFDLSLDLLCIAGFDGYFKRVNPEWEKVMGYTQEELLSRPYIELIHPDDVEGTRAVAARIAQGHSVISFENRYRAKDGSYRWLVWNAAPVPGEPIIYAAARDATERLAAEEERRRLHEDLESQARDLQAVNSELEAFTYSVSHDLRAPLRQVDGFARIMLNEYAASLDDQARHYLGRVRDGARQMGMLVDDLLNLSRVTRRELQVGPAPLRPIVESVVASLDQDLQGRAIEWQVDPLPSAPCDSALIRQVFFNLLTNAVKFTTPRSPARIHIGAVERNGETVIFVKDNGVGFDMKYADKLFGVFQRLHRAEDFEGTGIGLATVQRIVHKHGGRVWAEAEPDNGATFWFTLSEPQAREEFTPSEPQAREGLTGVAAPEANGAASHVPRHHQEKP